MGFDLPPELLELQATVRRIAQDKVRPGPARSTPRRPTPRTSSTSPRDRPARPGGPRGVRRIGAGILGLTIAMEEVAKYSNTAALMLLLTRLPTGPVLIAGSEEQSSSTCRGVATGDAPASASPSRRPAAMWSACEPKRSPTAMTGC